MARTLSEKGERTEPQIVYFNLRAFDDDGPSPIVLALSESPLEGAKQRPSETMRKKTDWTFGGSWPYAAKYFETEDGRMHYIDEGPRDARPVVMVLIEFLKR